MAFGRCVGLLPAMAAGALLAGSPGGLAIEYQRPLGKLRLLCDRTRVTAMLDQLLDNAVKYSPEGGQIDCSLVERQGRAEFIVRDSGIGLGLYLAREHARRMGGDITVESRPAVGSSFTLSRPLASSDAERGANGKGWK